MVLVPPLNDRGERSRRAVRFDGTPQTMIGKKIKVLSPPSSSEYREAVVENFNVQSKKYIGTLFHFSLPFHPTFFFHPSSHPCSF
jgi:hypothetical protein